MQIFISIVAALVALAILAVAAFVTWAVGYVTGHHAGIQDAVEILEKKDEDQSQEQ